MKLYFEGGMIRRAKQQGILPEEKHFSSAEQEDILYFSRDISLSLCRKELTPSSCN
jgi:hypothetical protein